jgi:hypothetical protein
MFSFFRRLYNTKWLVSILTRFVLTFIFCICIVDLLIILLDYTGGGRAGEWAGLVFSSFLTLIMLIRVKNESK